MQTIIVLLAPPANFTWAYDSMCCSIIDMHVIISMIDICPGRIEVSGGLFPLLLLSAFTAACSTVQVTVTKNLWINKIMTLYIGRLQKKYSISVNAGKNFYCMGTKMMMNL